MMNSYPGERLFNSNMTADSVFAITEKVSVYDATEYQYPPEPIFLFLNFTFTFTILQTPFLLSEGRLSLGVSFFVAGPP